MKTPLLRLASAGALSLFAATAHAEVYTQDFEGSPGGDVGSAFVVDGRLELTLNTNDNNGAFHILPIPDSSQGFIATFEVTITDNTDGAPADGFSFSYGAIPDGAQSTLPEEGWPTVTPVLSFEVDSWMNFDAEQGLNVAVNNIDLPGGFINGPILEDGTDAEPSVVAGVVTVSWYPGAGASFSTTGFVTNANFVNLPTPLDFMGNDDFSFAFAGRTGGANQEVLIDNLVITTGAPDSDGDGLPDAYEIANGLDPDDNGLDPNNNGVAGNPENGADGDPDSDNLTNIREFMVFTNPRDSDTDDDMLLDGEEVDGLAGARPATSPILADTDMDGLDDFLETNSGVFNGAADPGTDPTKADTDDDNSPDRREIVKNTDPLDGTVVPPTSPAGSYVQDFDGFPEGSDGMSLFDGSDIQGSDAIAGVRGDALRLTQDTIGGTRSSFRIPAIEGSSEGWTATFDLTLEDAFDNNNPADGFSFGYGAIPDFNSEAGDLAGPEAHGLAEEGWGSVEHLSFELKTYDVGTVDVGYTIGGNIDGFREEFDFLNQEIIFDGDTLASPVTFSWNPDTGASLSIETIGDIFTNVATPGFTGDDSYVFAFSTRTGGSTETLIIDNLVVTTETVAPPAPSFLISEITYDPGSGEVSIVWNSEAGRSYSVDVSPDLQGGWVEVAGPIEATGATTTFTDTGIPAGTERRFYRVRDVTP